MFGVEVIGTFFLYLWRLAKRKKVGKVGEKKFGTSSSVLFMIGKFGSKILVITLNYSLNLAKVCRVSPI